MWRQRLLCEKLCFYVTATTTQPQFGQKMIRQTVARLKTDNAQASMLEKKISTSPEAPFNKTYLQYNSVTYD